MDSDSYDDDEFHSKRPKNDVFMNYSYEDIGKQFISHLQGALSRRGFTISDHTMLPVGQDTRLHLLKAIEESEIYVVVFSTNYASSVMSLDELVDIMECLGRFDQRKVLPLFYKLEPSDVRSQDGSFKDAFQAHEANDNIDPKRVQKWKQSFRDAGQLCGLTLQNGDEGKFISDIVEQLEKMQSPHELHVADHPVVVGSRVKELISTLRLDSEDVLVVAVFGISGIGKTTIVRATYNKISSYFDVSCFLEGIHYRGGGHNWKIKLQNKLMSRLTQNDKFPSMHHHNDGVTKIRNLIRGRKILLVLDDVDNFEQLKSLGINPASFCKGSRIIVITRDKQSLGIIPYTSYQTTELNRRESLSLFNRLMFSRDNNLVNMEFIEEVVPLAGGLPLVLEVWSRYFIGHERKQWPSLLEKLKRIPHGDVQKQLQMSYDSLSVTAKNLFLDIACFFHGMGKEWIVDVLHDEESAFFPDIEIQHLVDKFLVVKDSCVMNKAIMEMGQEVIRQENVDEPGKRTRLISDRDILHLFRDCSGTDTVRSINLDGAHIEEPVTVQIEAFKKMSNLRFIQLIDGDGKLQWSFSSKDVTDKARSTFSFKHLKYLVRKRNKAPCKSMSACFSFKHLKYLDWDGFPCKSLDNIDMGNVVVIILRFSKMKKLWDGIKLLPPLPSQLTFIDATECGPLAVMPFDSMQNAYIFRSKVFKESLMNTTGLLIHLSGKELPEWCTYRNSGNNVLSFEAPIRFDSKICGLLCATTYYWPCPTIHNKTKEESQCVEAMDDVSSTLKVVFYPLNDKTVVVEAGDTVELRFDRDTSCGLRLVYEDDVIDLGLVLPS
ncbi:TMV resistance protein N [Artemisia annua]|uniref:TMV resistance protein N n=1 Tax=Artemisia annua TaxID=35608 RepID=A0A2U1MLR6_ARTAN|nr:TMV resistance protein N [Artemisia annua]